MKTKFATIAVVFTVTLWTLAQAADRDNPAGAGRATSGATNDPNWNRSNHTNGMGHTNRYGTNYHGSVTNRDRGNIDGFHKNDPQRTNNNGKIIP